MQEVLETKLRVILEQFGVDKTADVLDSAEAGQLFDELYLEAILHPDTLEESAAATLEKVREKAQANREQAGLLQRMEPLDPAAARAVMEHPLPRWVEKMTVSYMRAQGGTAVRQGDLWDLTWPDGGKMSRVTFTAPGERQEQNDI